MEFDLILVEILKQIYIYARFEEILIILAEFIQKKKS